MLIWRGVGEHAERTRALQPVDATSGWRAATFRTGVNLVAWM
jgi:hypothetical protein